MAIRTRIENDRIYLTGNTDDYREGIANLGGQWDEEKRAWYFSVDDQETAYALADKIPDKLFPGSKIIGEATYTSKNGKTGAYPILYVAQEPNPETGETSVKLALPDGSDTFWVTLENLDETRYYDEPKQWKDLQKQRALDKAIGEAKYKGKSYYLLHEKEMDDGAVRVCLSYTDGSKSFWTDKEKLDSIEYYNKGDEPSAQKPRNSAPAKGGGERKAKSGLLNRARRAAPGM